MGDLKVKVVKLCGEPVVKDEAFWDNKKWDIWTYDYARNLYMVVSFVASKVVKIESKIK